MIDIDKKGISKEDDNIEKIYEIYINILDKQKKNGIDKFIIFSLELFEKYMKYFTNQDLKSLIILKRLLNYIVLDVRDKKEKKLVHKDKNIKTFDSIEKNLNQIIHETGIYLCNQEKLENKEILNFILEDKNYIKHNIESKKEIIKVFEKRRK